VEYRVDHEFLPKLQLGTLNSLIGAHTCPMYWHLWWRGLTALLSQCVSFSFADVGRVSSAYIIFIFYVLAPRILEVGRNLISAGSRYGHEEFIQGRKGKGALL